MSGSPSAPRSNAATIAAEFFRLKAAAEAASLQHLQEQRQSVRRLVTMQQNKAFGLPTDAGLESMHTPGSIHVGDIYTQPPPLPQPIVTTATPAPPATNPLAKLAIGAAAAAAGLGIPIGAGLALPHLLNNDPPAATQPAAPPPIDLDTIGVLEPDRE